MTIRSSNCVYWLLEEVNGRQFPFSCFSTNQPPRASYWLHLSSLGRFSFDLLHVNQWSLCVLHQPLFSLLSRLLTLFSKTINHFDCCFLCLVCIFLGTSDTVLVKSKIFCVMVLGVAWLKPEGAGDMADAVCSQCDIPAYLQAVVPSSCQYTLFTWILWKVGIDWAF